MIVDYRDNAPFSENGVFKPFGTLVDVLKQSLLALTKRGAIKSPRHNINLYMPHVVVADFRKAYRHLLSKRNKVRYAKLLSKNIVVIGGYRLQIRTKCKGVPLNEWADGFADIWMMPS